MSKSAIALLLLISLAFLGCGRERGPSSASQPFPRETVIREIKDFEKSLGFEETTSFSRHAPDKQAYYRCYYTEKLRLPDSYDELKVKDGSEQGCDIDEQKYDVFFYRIEAVASGKTPATSALEQASVERLAMVVSHEDFHQQKPIRRLPTAVEEASATLIGFLTAAEYAKMSHGADSALYWSLSPDAATFLEKAKLVNLYHDKLKALYSEVTGGAMDRAAALAEKQRLFGELDAACKAIARDPGSFNKCPAALNNAGLAFDRTYTKHYPLLYRLAVDHKNDLRGLIETLQQLPASKRWSEQDAVAYLEGILRSESD